MTKPMLLLDIDGVIKPWGYRLDPEAADKVAVLGRHFEVHWATLWNGDANLKMSPRIGVGDLPGMHCSDRKGWRAATKAGWERPEDLWFCKTPLIPEYVDGRPFAWIDDDIDGPDHQYLHWILEPDHRFLLVATEAAVGMTWDHVHQLVDWGSEL